MTTWDARERRLIGRWAVLVALTLISWASYDGAGWLSPSSAGALALALAAAKIRIVVLDFMAIREAPPLLRLPLAIWPFLLGGVMVFLYLAAPN